MDPNIVNSILLVVQLASLLALIIYVIKTWEMASASRQSAEISAKTLLEMKEARDQEIAPYVVVYFDKKAENLAFDLVIKNTGRSMAHNVRLEFSPPLTVNPILQPFINRFLPPNVIPTMPPDYEIRTSLGIFQHYCAENYPEQYMVKVEYQGGITSTLRLGNYLLDLSPFHGLAYSSKTKPNEIANALNALNKTGKEIKAEIRELRKNNRIFSKKKIRRNL